jgi:hypothetical protein
LRVPVVNVWLARSLALCENIVPVLIKRENAHP